MRKVFRMVATFTAFCAVGMPLGFAADDSGGTAAARRVLIPEREHGYSNMKSVLIRSQDELDDLLQEVQKQDGWNDREGFVEAIEDAELDFDSEVLVIVRNTENSGSIRVTLKDPVLHDGVLSFRLDRDTPEMVTHDMAYYAFAFAVSKAEVEAVDLGFKGGPVKRVSVKEE